MESEFQPQEGQQPDQPVQSPQFDPAQLQEHIGHAIQQGFQRYAPPPPPPPPLAPDPVREVINPYLRPVAQYLNLQTQLAQDAAVFYPTTPSAVQFKDRIEEIVAQRANAGQPITRAQAWSYLRGSELFDQLVESTIRERVEAANRAHQNMSLGPGMGRSPQGPVLDANYATDDQLEHALKGMPF